MSFLKGLEEGEQSAVSIVQRQDTTEGLVALEDTILQDCAAVVSAASRFAEITPSDPQPPEEWIANLGEKQARMAHRVAQQAWLPKKDAAMGVEMCFKAVLGIIHSRSKRNETKHALQVNIVAMPPPDFGEYKMIDEQSE